MQRRTSSHTERHTYISPQFPRKKKNKFQLLKQLKTNAQYFVHKVLLEKEVKQSSNQNVNEICLPKEFLALRIFCFNFDRLNQQKCRLWKIVFFLYQDESKKNAQKWIVLLLSTVYLSILQRIGKTIVLVPISSGSEEGRDIFPDCV